ncbi:MAG: hypothetical protein K0M50_02965 [Prolixibacteraceae bacterium]|nr:hypothetical protein [Prolixibacteraceae bacterium]
MKRFVILAFVGLITINTAGQTAQNIDAIKKENLNLKAVINSLKQDTAFLNKKINMCDFFNQPKEFELVSFSKDFNVELLSCKGDRGLQTVMVEVLISHKLPHQEVCMGIRTDDAQAADELGNFFAAKEASIANQTTTYRICATVPSGVPTKSYIIFRNIMPSTDILKFLTLRYRFRNADGGGSYSNGNLEIRNLKIQW